MKFRYTGDMPSITLREVTFKRGELVDLTDNPELAQKVKALPYFRVGRAKRKQEGDTK